uniref:NADH dehydrogenase subunit 9 n=1 Tax=Storeatula sp. CCMP1868 TaxID=195070 RepID=A0A2P1G8E0_9CRYP|nr:NADH dehydrogenase subunit 9 [Storeatula sp. CCMP1868]AVM81156.1 NADH dehydrogenase subunit 9 [Storeatula sp. CCMP1868]
MSLNIYKFVYRNLKNFIKINNSFHGLLIETQKNKLKQILFFLKNNEFCYCKMLIEIFAIDLVQKNRRFCLNYLLRSLKYNYLLTLQIFISQNSTINSITMLFKNGNWMEREAWDMTGIFFHNHPDLRRILTDYGFEGFPLRKDFPLSGFKEVRYDDSQKRVVSEQIELSQEFRLFTFESPWNKHYEKEQ